MLRCRWTKWYFWRPRHAQVASVTTFLTCLVTNDSQNTHVCTLPRHRHIVTHIKTGPRGGKLFEAFLLTCGSDDTYTSLCRDIDRLRAGVDIDTEYYDALLSEMSLRFYTWLMMGTHTRKKTLQQRHLLSFVMHFHGLSRQGLMFLHRAGIGSSRSSFNRWWKAELQRQADRTRY